MTQTDRVWDTQDDYWKWHKANYMTNGQLLEEFHTAFKSKRDIEFGSDPALETLATKLIMEEFNEFMDEDGLDQAALLGELADLVYVAYGYADRFGWNLDEALRRKHIANMSKLDENGEPILREDGKILKSENFKPANLDDLV